jgi:hypothetical protein
LFYAKQNYKKTGMTLNIITVMVFLKDLRKSLSFHKF